MIDNNKSLEYLRAKYPAFKKSTDELEPCDYELYLSSGEFVQLKKSKSGEIDVCYRNYQRDDIDEMFYASFNSDNADAKKEVDDFINAENSEKRIALLNKKLGVTG